MATSALPEMLTPAQVAEWLQINRRTLYKMNTEGRGPRPFKVGSATRYRREDVDAWMAGETK